MTISAMENSICFMCENQDISCLIKFGDSGCTVHDLEGLSGTFPYKEMALCVNFSDLSNVCYIYLKEDYPLVIRFPVSYLGDIKLCFAPVCGSSGKELT